MNHFVRNNQSPPSIPDQLLKAVVRHAERQAELTAAFLDDSGFNPGRPLRLPAEFLLELAAVLELKIWESRGIRPCLNVDLPTFHEAGVQLAARATRGPHEFQGPNATYLSRLAMQVWIAHFAWDGLDNCQTEVIVGQIDEDQFVELMADFIWTHRHKLAGGAYQSTTNP